jgi:hypothetical protein
LTCHTMIVFYSQWFLERNKGNEIYWGYLWWLSEGSVQNEKEEISVENCFTWNRAQGHEPGHLQWKGKERIW